jgi:hypothetical protein
MPVPGAAAARDVRIFAFAPLARQLPRNKRHGDLAAAPRLLGTARLGPLDPNDTYNSSSSPRTPTRTRRGQGEYTLKMARLVLTVLALTAVNALYEELQESRGTLSGATVGDGTLSHCFSSPANSYCCTVACDSASYGTHPNDPTCGGTRVATSAGTRPSDYGHTTIARRSDSI